MGGPSFSDNPSLPALGSGCHGGGPATQPVTAPTPDWQTGSVTVAGDGPQRFPQAAVLGFAEQGLGRTPRPRPRGRGGRSSTRQDASAGGHWKDERPAAVFRVKFRV